MNRTHVIHVTRPIAVYEHISGDADRFPAFDLDPGSYPSEVRAVARADLLWLCLQVPGCEARTIGGRREMLERRPGVKIETLCGSGPPGEVESAADSPPSAAGGPEIREPLVAKAVADLTTTGMAHWGESATEAEVREIHGRAKPLADAGMIPDGRQAMARLSRDRLCGHPHAASGVVVPGAEGDGDEPPEYTGHGWEWRYEIEAARNVSAFAGHEINAYVGRLRAKAEKYREELNIALRWMHALDTVAGALGVVTNEVNPDYLARRCREAIDRIRESAAAPVVTPAVLDALADRIAGAVGCYGFCSVEDGDAIAALICDEADARGGYGSEANHAGVRRWVAGVLRVAIGQAVAVEPGASGGRTGAVQGERIEGVDS